MSAPATLSVERHGAVAVVTFRRPDQLNAINTPMQGEITDTFLALGRDPGVNVIVVTGEGRGFMAGADIKEYAGEADDAFDAFQKRGGAMYAAIEDNPKPVIAAVNGYALGGGFELVLCCDLVVASSAAKMGLPEVKLGLVPGGGGTQRGVRKLGANRAAYLLMTGAMLPAAAFEQYGLVTLVTEPGELMPRALALAGEIATASPDSIRALKALVRVATESDLATGLDRERDAVCSLFRTGFARDRVREFAEKSAARERGKRG
ncbi:MAG: enoyl-CoA hydratase/isomerase family protein [Bauldia sp.]|uniref:enoyl-CoA hydratase/isomerase family protein n=1 Tax=Bauldia sp. TaxID=2575872 RepID=UPI001DF3E12C|nr:enoyl-CoA hydratase/isomerase family protein [Bauldia sp.]MCB1495088.1 enoyl-CoA hydratase/isomerase family protein [Bauldia sp.]